MLLALATCVYDVWYKPEFHVSKGEVRTFDNMCSGDLERDAAVLQKSGFTNYIDDIGRRSEFVCCPDDFQEIAFAVPASLVSVDDIDLVSVDDIEEAVMRLAGGRFEATLEIERPAERIARGS